MRVFLDSAPLIYLIEARSEYVEQVSAQLSSWVKNEVMLGTSTLTLLELLVVPKREGDERLARKYRAILSELLCEPMIPLSEPIAEKAAAYRTELNLKPPDAIQLATAVYSGYDVFYTNDKIFKRCADIEIVFVV